MSGIFREFRGKLRMNLPGNSEHGRIKMQDRKLGQSLFFKRNAKLGTCTFKMSVKQNSAIKKRLAQHF